ncbi:cuticle protein CP1499-like [Macrobrachium rosenbergii]|uniref:cuticle protein CP1499-like n=1 Tax=Macrobrachium rosenbergii TaxID=79674 RepID=UPI0034D76876
MRTLVALAVLGMLCALPHQAFGFSGASYGLPQPRWPGPFAANLPAGVNGQITPVSDTNEVSEARRVFFDAYQRQLSSVGGVGRYAVAAAALRPAAPVHAASVPVPAFRPAAGTYSVGASSSSSSFGSHSSSFGGHRSFSSHVIPSNIVVSRGHVQDTPEVAAAKSEFYALFDRQAAAAAAAPDDPVTYY